MMEEVKLADVIVFKSQTLKLVKLFQDKGLLAYPVFALLKDELLDEEGRGNELARICSRYDLETLAEPRNLDTLLALHEHLEAHAVQHAQLRMAAFYNDATLLDAHQRASQGSSDILASTTTSSSSSSEGSAFIYGEVEYASFLHILNIASTGMKARSHGKFVDLGSGIAKAVLWTSLVSKFLHIVGIEINQRLWQKSVDILDDFDSQLYAPLFITPRSHLQKARLELVLGSVLSLDIHDWTDADLVFANSAAFTPELMQGITTLSLKMQRGARFITLAHKLEHELWRVIYRDRQEMSWGITTVWIFEKCDND